MVNAQDESNNGQDENLESVPPDMDPDALANSTLSNFSLPDASFSTEDGDFTRNDNATPPEENTSAVAEPTITEDNATPPEENTSAVEEPTITEDNATPPEENTSAGEEPTITEDNATPPEENTSAGEEPITEDNATAPEENTSAGEEPITEDNATAPEENTSAVENVTTSEPTTAVQENVTTSEPTTAVQENVTTSEPTTAVQENVTSSSANNISSSNVFSVAPNFDVDIINSNADSSTDQALPAEQPGVNNITSANRALAIATTETNADTLDQTSSPEDTLGAQVSNQIDSAASALAGVSVSNSNVENNQIINIQNVINNIAISAAQSGANSQNVAQQISKEVIANPTGQIAKSVKQLANEFVRGNPDEVNIAANQIGNLIGKGNNIQQTLVQVTNNVVNNIKNIKATENNYNKVIIRPSITTQQKTEIKQTVDVIKKAKQEVEVPRIHIKFDSHERNLVLRILSTNNFKYEMPFSKFNGAFTLDENEFRVKVLSGDGSVKAASVAPMFKSGKVGDRNFLDKDVENGKVFFSLKDIKSGRYLLEVYIKLSNGAIATFARGSVSIK